MYKARHNRFYLGFIVAYYKLLTRIYFRGIKVYGSPNQENRPVLLLQNHFSWWDGYWSLFLSTVIFKKRFHVMMLEEELEKHMFLNRCGVYSVKKNDREVIESLNYSRDILNSPANLVTIYPEGEIGSLHRQTFRFAKGPEWILKRSKNEIAVYFAIVLIDYFSLPRPLISIYLLNYNGSNRTGEMSEAYNAFYQECVKKQVPD
jgi:1-acyl-sn-glycerol-3-phosphate acyltransferase